MFKIEDRYHHHSFIKRAFMYCIALVKISSFSLSGMMKKTLVDAEFVIRVERNGNLCGDGVRVICEWALISLDKIFWIINNVLLISGCCC